MNERLAANLEAVERRIIRACSKAGRARESVRLVAVTKYASDAAVTSAYAAGLRDFGESRPQQLWRRAAQFPPDLRWHLIGHLQRNKVEKTLHSAALIHSVDSVRLLDEIARGAQRQRSPADVLIEVHLSGEEAKSGFAPHELTSLCPVWDSVNIHGLMTMAALQVPEECRPTFERLRRLRDDLSTRWGRPLPELSMGMSNDFEVAVEEGATLVRIGSSIFDGVP